MVVRSYVLIVGWYLIFGIAHSQASPNKKGSLSLGEPNAGALLHPAILKSNEHIQARDESGRSCGTDELVSVIEGAVNYVHQHCGETYRVVVGDLSRRKGGRMHPHLSHQSGRDVDVGYFLKQSHSPTYFKKATRQTLDAERTWRFLEYIIKQGELEYAFIHWRLQKPLYEQALKNGFSKEELSPIFQYPRKRGQRVGKIRHVRGHADHIHIRIHAKSSLARGRAYLAEHPEAIKPRPVYYRVKKGDTLSRIARRKHTKISQLRRWNRLRKKTVIRPGTKLIVGFSRPDPT